jgi:hypothetical protein
MTAVMAEAASDTLARAMTEKELAYNVLDAARKLGWRVYYTRYSLHSPKGWPDLVLIREVNEEQARIIFAELKVELRGKRGQLTPEQEETLHLLAMTGHGAYCWRPSDWFAGRIDEVLL